MLPLMILIFDGARSAFAPLRKQRTIGAGLRALKVNIFPMVVHHDGRTRAWITTYDRLQSFYCKYTPLGDRGLKCHRRKQVLDWARTTRRSRTVPTA